MAERPDTSIEVHHEEGKSHGAFFVQRSGVRLAEMTYSRVSAAGIRVATEVIEAHSRVLPGTEPDVVWSHAPQVSIDHTEVGDQLRGLGVGRRMLDTLVTWARTTETKVIASCPYVKAQFERDASIRDVLA